MPCLTGTSQWCCITRLTTAAGGYVDVELKCKAYVFTCLQRKIDSGLVFILPFAYLVIFNLYVKIKAAFTHTLNKLRSPFDSEGINM